MGILGSEEGERGSGGRKGARSRERGILCNVMCTTWMICGHGITRNSLKKVAFLHRFKLSVEMCAILSRS